MPNALLRLGAHSTPGLSPKTPGLVTPCSASGARVAAVSPGTSHHGAASLLRDRCLCQPRCRPSPSPQLAPLRSVTRWPLAWATSTREEPTGCPRTQGALEGRAPAVLAGRWDRQDYPHSTSLTAVSPSLWSLWASAGTSHTKTTQAEGCAAHHGLCEQLSVPSALIVPFSAPVPAQASRLAQLLRHSRVPKSPGSSGLQQVLLFIPCLIRIRSRALLGARGGPAGLAEDEEEDEDEQRDDTVKRNCHDRSGGESGPHRHCPAGKSRARSSAPRLGCQGSD